MVRLSVDRELARGILVAMRRMVATRGKNLPQILLRAIDGGISTFAGGDPSGIKQSSITTVYLSSPYSVLSLVSISTISRPSDSTISRPSDSTSAVFCPSNSCTLRCVLISVIPSFSP